MPCGPAASARRAPRRSTHPPNADPRRRARRDRLGLARAADRRGPRSDGGARLRAAGPTASRSLRAAARGDSSEQRRGAGGHVAERGERRIDARTPLRRSPFGRETEGSVRPGRESSGTRCRAPGPCRRPEGVHVLVSTRRRNSWIQARFADPGVSRTTSTTWPYASRRRLPAGVERLRLAPLRPMNGVRPRRARRLEAALRRGIGPSTRWVAIGWRMPFSLGRRPAPSRRSLAPGAAWRRSRGSSRRLRGRRREPMCHGVADRGDVASAVADELGDHRVTGMDAEADGQTHAVPRTSRTFSCRMPSSIASASVHGTLGGVLERVGIAEMQRSSRRRGTARSCRRTGAWRRPSPVLVRANQRAEILRIDAIRERRRLDQIAEDDRQLTALADLLVIPDGLARRDASSPGCSPQTRHAFLSGGLSRKHRGQCIGFGSPKGDRVARTPPSTAGRSRASMGAPPQATLCQLGTQFGAVLPP